MVKSMRLIFISVLFLVTVVMIAVGIEKPKLVRFTSLKDGMVISVPVGQAISGVNLTSTFWKNIDTQKWMTISTDDGNIYILAKSQHKDWTSFMSRINSKGSSSTISTPLPTVSLVMAVDSNTGFISQQLFRKGPNQTWKLIDLKSDKFLIKNSMTGNCIRENYLTPKDPTFLQRTTSKIKEFIGKKSSDPIEITFLLEAVTCDENNVLQQWRMDMTP